MADPSRLIRALNRSRGALGKQRAQQLVDTTKAPEIFSLKGLREALESGDPLTKFDPAEFEDYAIPMFRADPGDDPRINERAWEFEKRYPTYVDIANALKKKGALREMPFLGFEEDPAIKELMNTWSHEGRHRSRLMAEARPGDPSAVKLKLDFKARTGVDEPFGDQVELDNFLKDYYEEKLFQGLDRWDKAKYVRPQSYWNYGPTGPEQVIRPAIKKTFEPFRRGGEVG